MRVAANLPHIPFDKYNAYFLYIVEAMNLYHSQKCKLAVASAPSDNNLLYAVYVLKSYQGKRDYKKQDQWTWSGIVDNNLLHSPTPPPLCHICMYAFTAAIYDKTYPTVW